MSCVTSPFFRLHVCGQLADDSVFQDTLCRILLDKAYTWNWNQDKRIDVIVRHDPDACVAGYAVSWSAPKDRSWLWLAIDASTNERKCAALSEIEQYLQEEDLPNHSRREWIGQTCFEDPFSYFRVHYVGGLEHMPDVTERLSFILQEEAQRLSLLLPGSTVDIVFAHDPSDCVPGMAAGGHALRELIWLPINSNSPIHELIEAVRGSIRHEMHHYRRMQCGQTGGRTDDRLLDHLVFEGLAVAFEEECDPGAPIPYAHAVPDNELCELWDIAKRHLESPNLYHTWMGGGDGLPVWAGYTLGYHLIQAYLRRHPHTSPSRLVGVSADAILVGSGWMAGEPC